MAFWPKSNFVLTFKITYYTENEYEKAEKDAHINNALVSVNQMQEIQEAYPNYFLRINDFREIIKHLPKTRLKPIIKA